MQENAHATTNINQQPSPCTQPPGEEAKKKKNSKYPPPLSLLAIFPALWVLPPPNIRTVQSPQPLHLLEHQLQHLFTTNHI